MQNVSRGGRNHGQAAVYLLLHRAPHSADRPGGRDLAAGVRLSGTAAGGGGRHFSVGALGFDTLVAEQLLAL